MNNTKRLWNDKELKTETKRKKSQRHEIPDKIVVHW